MIRESYDQVCDKKIKNSRSILALVKSFSKWGQTDRQTGRQTNKPKTEREEAATGGQECCRKGLFQDRG